MLHEAKAQQRINFWVEKNVFENAVSTLEGSPDIAKAFELAPLFKSGVKE